MRKQGVLLVLIATVAIAMSAVQTARAAPIELVTNGDFEAALGSEWSFGDGSFNRVTGYNGNDYNIESGYFPAHNLYGGYKYQDTGHVLLPNTVYNYSIDVGGYSGTPTGNMASVIYAGPPGGAPPTQLDFVGQEAYTPGAGEGVESTPDGWQTVHGSFTTGDVGSPEVGQNLWVRPISAWSSNPALFYLDNVSISYDPVAQIIPLVNRSFENDPGDDGWENPVLEWQVGINPTGFVASRGEDSGVHANYPDGGAIDGDLYANFYGNSWLYQMTDHDLTAGEVYTLSMDIADSISEDAGLWCSMQLLAGEDWSGGSNPVANMTYNQVTGAQAQRNFRTFSTTFDTTDPVNAAFMADNEGDSIWVRITTGPYGASPLPWFYVDDVQLTYTPEPVTMVLLGLGGLVLRRRRR